MRSICSSPPFGNAFCPSAIALFNVSINLALFWAVGSAIAASRKAMASVSRVVSSSNLSVLSGIVLAASTRFPISSSSPASMARRYSHSLKYLLILSVDVFKSISDVLAISNSLSPPAMATESASFTCAWSFVFSAASTSFLYSLMA